MSEPAEKLYDEAMKLPPGERRSLVLRLLDSVGEEPEDDVERAWLEEARRRLADVASGREETVPWEDVRRELLDRE